MRNLIAVAACAGLLTGCGMLPMGDGGEGGWPFPNTDLATLPAPSFPTMAPVDLGAMGLAPRAEGTIVDQYGAAMAGVTLCVGPSEAEAVPLGTTDASGYYSVTLDADAISRGRLLLWPFLPLTRFEPEGFAFEGVLLGGSTYDFKGVPAIYPVPPEKDCR
jgi:hypothetical protein